MTQELQIALSKVYGVRAIARLAKAIARGEQGGRIPYTMLLWAITDGVLRIVPL